VVQILGHERGDQAVFLSGPSFAVEVVARQPTCVAVASKSLEHAQRTQQLFHAPHFRVYNIDDVVGIEIAGALKNVIAIASGACTGAGYQMNARAAIITRGLAEIVCFI
jgi:glycerol-3-phosphate dehydrogenase (NAD(P)+)